MIGLEVDRWFGGGVCAVPGDPVFLEERCIDLPTDFQPLWELMMLPGPTLYVFAVEVTVRTAVPSTTQAVSSPRGAE